MSRSNNYANLDEFIVFLFHEKEDLLYRIGKEHAFPGNIGKETRDDDILYEDSFFMHLDKQNFECAPVSFYTEEEMFLYIINIRMFLLF